MDNNNNNKQFCIKCGSEIPVGSEFCPKCGTNQVIVSKSNPVEEPEHKPDITNWHTFIILVGWVCTLIGFANGPIANSVFIGFAIGVYADSHYPSKYGKYLWIASLIIFALQIIQGFITGFNATRY